MPNARWTDSTGAGATFGSDQLLKRPELALRIAIIASAWAQLETMLGSTLGGLMRADPRTTIALLGRFTTATQKAQAARDVARESLTDEDFDKFRADLRDFEALARERNNVLHGLWGTSDAEPDALLWMRPEGLATGTITLLTNVLTGKLKEPSDYSPPPMERYDLLRFQGIESKIEALTRRFARWQSTAMALSAVLAVARGEASPDIKVTFGF